MRRMITLVAAREVVVVVYQDVQSLDVVGPVEVLASANRMTGRAQYRIGVTAGMDLALALVEDDLGRDVALAVARQLVLFLRRPGNQAQFSAQLSAQTAERDGLRDLQTWIAEHPGDDLTVAAMARRAGLS